MSDYTDDNYSRFNPYLYIKTDSGGLLGLLKFLEVIAAGIILYGLYHSSSDIMISIIRTINAIVEALTKSLKSISNPTYVFLNQFPTLLSGFVYDLSADLSRYIMNFFKTPSYMLIFMLILIILDGIGTVNMIYGDSGEGLIRFVHLIRWIGCIIRIITFITAVILYHYDLIHMVNVYRNSISFSELITNIGSSFYIIAAVYVAILLFFCGYHHDIYTILKTVQEEKQTGRIAAVSNNHLKGRSTLLTLFSGVIFLGAAGSFYYYYPAIIESGILRPLPNLDPKIILAAVCVICFLIFLKFLSLKFYIQKFLKYHQI